MKFEVCSLRLVRDRSVEYAETYQLDCGSKIADLMRGAFSAGDLPEEHLWLICADKQLHVRSVIEITKGDSDSSIFPIKQILKTALISGADRFIVCHNHPSGNVEPSNADLQSTKLLLKGAKAVDLDFTDHVIVSYCNQNSLRQSTNLW